MDDHDFHAIHGPPASLLEQRHRSHSRSHVVGYTCPPHNDRGPLRTRCSIPWVQKQPQFLREPDLTTTPEEAEGRVWTFMRYLIRYWTCPGNAAEPPTGAQAPIRPRRRRPACYDPLGSALSTASTTLLLRPSGQAGYTGNTGQTETRNTCVRPDVTGGSV